MIEKYKLLDPIQHGEETITELEFMKIKGKHLKKLDGVIGDNAKALKMIEICANIPPSVVDELAVHDVVNIIKIIENFF